MIYTPDTKKAIKLCFEAHRNQTDKSGLPYEGENALDNRKKQNIFFGATCQIEWM